ncbi:MAG: head maturation protease, ClpP-related [Clostridia bacterium]
MGRTKDNLKEFLAVKNSTFSTADLYFYGDIVSSWWGAWNDADQYPEAVRDFLDGCEGKSLNIYINSGGGNVFAGIAIYNMLKRHKGFKTVYVDGLAASIASVIALAGDRIVIPSNAFLMIHKPYSNLDAANADECRKMAADLDIIETGIMNIYREHLRPGVDAEEIRNMVNAETWLNGEEAAKYFDVEVSEAKEFAAYGGDICSFCAKTPKMLVSPVRADNAETTAARNKITTLVLQGITKGV